MRNLTAEDLARHQELGIPPELLEQAGCARVTDAEARALLSSRHSGDLTGVVYPYRDPVTGARLTCRLRRDHPEIENGTPRDKYLSAFGDSKHVFFPPGAGELLTDTSAPIIIVEAEKSVLAIMAAADRTGRRVLAMGTGGCWGWRGRIGKTTDASGARVDEKGPLLDLTRLIWRDRDVVISFDANAATNTSVRAACRVLAKDLTGRGARVRIGELPIEDGINGPDDYVGKHGDAALFALLDAAKPGAARRRRDDDGDEVRGQKRSQATVLIRLAQEAGASYFHDDDQPYLHVPVGDHHETYPLRSRIGRAWLQGLFIDATQRCAGSQAIADAMNGLEAFALRGPKNEVHVRIAATPDAIYLDLGSSSWRVVEIRATGWRIVAEVPVRFRRPKGLLPLPSPTSGGSILTLRRFVNVSSDDDFVVLVMVLVAMLRGRGPYPVLVVNGEQGSAKSTLARIIKALIDSNVAPLRSEPREPRDLMIAAANSHILAFDNLSGISPWLSDCFCRLSTGGGFSTRMLYENAEEQIFDEVKPVVLNGIPELATRPDLVSRSVLQNLPPISDARRRDERAFWAAFEHARPEILGALLDIVVAAVAREADVDLEHKPRMADFAIWAVAAEAACPWSQGTFLKVYASNTQQAIEATLDGDPVADLARELASQGAIWSGTAAELLEVLNRRTPEATQRRQDWFRRPRQIADALRRLAPALRQVGVDLRFLKLGHSRTRTIEIEKVCADASAASASSVAPNLVEEADGPWGGVDPSSSASSAGWTSVCGGQDAADAADAVRPVRSNDDEWEQAW